MHPPGRGLRGERVRSFVRRVAQALPKRGPFWLAQTAALVAVVGSGCGETSLSASVLLATNPGSGGQSSGGASDGLIEVGGLGPVPVEPAPYEPAATLFVADGKLRDHCGEPIVLRGIDEFIAWTKDADGVPEFFQMAKTGANAVRVLWRDTATSAELDVALSEAVNQGLVPVVELQDSFRSGGEAAALGETMSYWLEPGMMAVLLKHQRSLIVEISSWVTQSAASDGWVQLYADAIGQFRGAGLELPIAIVDPSWGFNHALLADSMVELEQRDPIGNVLLAFDFWVASPTFLDARFGALEAAQVASYISEFSDYGILDCPGTDIDVAGVLASAARYSGSWFAWSWGAIPNSLCADLLDMTLDGTVETLTPYGALVALEDPNGISRTASAVKTLGMASCPSMP